MEIYRIKDFLNNPAGKGNTLLNISLVKANFTDRYNKIVKLIKHRIFFVKDDIYFLINIPSSVDKVFYDILVKFTPDSKSPGISIADMNMQVFSNSPSWLYTYAYAYQKHDLFIKECRKKLSSQMLKDIAKVKNPYGMLSYDFSIFAALYYIVNNDYLNIEMLKNESLSEKRSLSYVLSLVQNADTLQKNRKLQKDYNKLEEEEKLKKSKNKISKFKEPTSDTTEDIKDIKKTKVIKSSKKVKKIKKI